MKKESIILCTKGGINWMGGVYYVKNISYVLSQNQYILSNFNLVFVSDYQTDKFIGELPPEVIKERIKSQNKIGYTIELINLIIRYKAAYIYPKNTQIPFLKAQSIAWIPDFQHIRMPNMFSAEEIFRRNSMNSRLVDSNIQIILSSNDALNDFKSKYKYRKKPVVMHFVSYIEDVICEALKIKEEVVKKYDLESNRYAIIPNQFWKHKNHLTVFKAIKLWCNISNESFKFITTGNLNDYRNPEYISVVKDYFEDSVLKKHLVNIGFIDRTEQIAIMSAAKFVIQPSLFEGWSTVVEDAKALNKLLVVSDIPVHREQTDSNCIFFEPMNEIALVDAIKQAIQSEHIDNINKGIIDTRKRAKIYSESFVDIINGN